MKLLQQRPSGAASRSPNQPHVANMGHDLKQSLVPPSEAGSGGVDGLQGVEDGAEYVGHP
jgi:hypothetical protein